MLLGFVDASTERTSAHGRGASERGLLRLFDEAGVDFVDETRTLAEGEVAVTVTLLGIAERKFGHGTGDGHVKQTTFLFQLLACAEAEDAREEVLFHADDIDRRELQALRAVDGHQADKVLVGVVFLHFAVGEQCHVFHELH